MQFISEVFTAVVRSTTAVFTAGQDATTAQHARQGRRVIAQLLPHEINCGHREPRSFLIRDACHREPSDQQAFKQLAICRTRTQFPPCLRPIVPQPGPLQAKLNPSLDSLNQASATRRTACHQHGPFHQRLSASFARGFTARNRLHQCDLPQNACAPQATLHRSKKLSTFGHQGNTNRIQAGLNRKQNNAQRCPAVN